MPDTYDFTLYQGEIFNTRIINTNSDGSYVNLSGYTASGIVKWRYGQSGYLFDLTPSIDTSYVSGVININLTGNIIQNIPVGKHIYAINLYNQSGKTILLEGKMVMYPAVL